MRCLSLSDSDAPSGGSDGGKVLSGGGGFPTSDAKSGGSGGTGNFDGNTSDAPGGAPSGGNGGAGGNGGTGGSGGSGDACPPFSCTDVGIECGITTDACGEPIDCGSCGNFQTCGDSKKCVGIGGQWSVQADTCNGVNVLDPVVQSTFIFQIYNIIEIDGQDADCNFFEGGNLVLVPPSTINVQLNYGQCTPSLCAYGSNNTTCLSNNYAPPKQFTGTLVFVEPNTLQLTLPSSSQPACDSAGSRVLLLKRI